MNIAYFTTRSNYQQVHEILREAGFTRVNKEEFSMNDTIFALTYTNSKDERVQGKYFIKLEHIGDASSLDQYISSKEYLTNSLKDVVLTNKFAEEERQRARNPIFAGILSFLA